MMQINEFLKKAYPNIENKPEGMISTDEFGNFKESNNLYNDWDYSIDEYAVVKDAETKAVLVNFTDCMRFCEVPAGMLEEFGYAESSETESTIQDDVNEYLEEATWDDMEDVIGTLAFMLDDSLHLNEEEYRSIIFSMYKDLVDEHIK